MPRVQSNEPQYGQETPKRVTNARNTEVELVRRAAEGEVEAYEQLYREHAGRVLALCLRMTRDRGEAEELVQDVFVRVWEKLGSFRGGSAFSTWLHRVAVNTVIESLRTKARWRDRHDAAADPEAAMDLVFAKEAGADIDLERAIAQLPVQARMVFVLHDIEGHKHREIADLTGLAVGTCKAHVHRARQLLRDSLGNQLGGVSMSWLDRWRRRFGDTEDGAETQDPELVALLSRARSLPRSIEPERDLWSGVENRIFGSCGGACYFDGGFALVAWGALSATTRCGGDGYRTCRDYGRDGLVGRRSDRGNDELRRHRRH